MSIFLSPDATCNRVVATTHHLGGQSIVRYDSAGNRTFTIDAEQRVTAYTHSLYRLDGVTNSEQESTTYQYDALCNKLFETDPSTSSGQAPGIIIRGG